MRTWPAAVQALDACGALSQCASSYRAVKRSRMVERRCIYCFGGIRVASRRTVRWWVQWMRWRDMAMREGFGCGWSRRLRRTPPSLGALSTPCLSHFPTLLVARCPTVVAGQISPPGATMPGFALTCEGMPAPLPCCAPVVAWQQSSAGVTRPDLTRLLVDWTRLVVAHLIDRESEEQLQPWTTSYNPNLPSVSCEPAPLRKDGLCSLPTHYYPQSQLTGPD